jgi:hypothetical protein
MGAKCPWGELSWCKLSKGGGIVHGVIRQWSEISTGQNVLSAKCPWGQMSMGRNIHGVKCPCDKMWTGQNIHGTSCHGASFSTGRVATRRVVQAPVLQNTLVIPTSI